MCSGAQGDVTLLLPGEFSWLLHELFPQVWCLCGFLVVVQEIQVGLRLFLSFLGVSLEGYGSFYFSRVSLFRALWF